MIKVNNEWEDFKDNIHKLDKKGNAKKDMFETSYTYMNFHDNVNWKFAILEGNIILNDDFEDIWDVEKGFMKEIKKGRDYTTTIRMSRIFWYEDGEFEAVICAVRIEVKKNDLILYKRWEDDGTWTEDSLIGMTKEESEEYCKICGVRVDSFGMERHTDWCPNKHSIRGKL